MQSIQLHAILSTKPDSALTATAFPRAPLEPYPRGGLLRAAQNATGEGGGRRPWGPLWTVG